MAPSRRRSGNKGKAKEKLKSGDLVIAKVKGFPAWPAKISKPEDWDRSPHPPKYFVEFFGTSEIDFVAPADIQAFTSESKSKLLAQCQGKTAIHFASAVQEICVAFDKLQQNNSDGCGEDIDGSVVGCVPSLVDGLEDINNQVDHRTSNLEDQEEKFDKSECSSDETHGLEHCTQSQDVLGSAVHPICSVGNDSAKFSARKRKQMSDNGRTICKKGKTVVAKLTSGTPSNEEDCSTSPHLNNNEKNGTSTLSKSQIRGTLISNSTACQNQDLCTPDSPTSPSEGVCEDSVENVSTHLENAVNERKMADSDDNAALVVNEPVIISDSLSEEKKSHKCSKKRPIKESGKFGGRENPAESRQISPRCFNEIVSGKSSNNLKNSKKHVSENDTLHGVRKDALTLQVTEGLLSSHPQGKMSLISGKKQKLVAIDHSRPAKRSKFGDESLDKISRYGDSSHFAGKAKGDKVVKSKQSLASLQNGLLMASNSATQRDRKHKVIQEHPPSKHSGQVSEMTSISARRSATHMTERCPGVANDGISLTTHVLSRRRTFLLDDDDDDDGDVHGTPVHRQSTSILNSAHLIDQVAESCRDSPSIINNASTENVHFTKEEIASADQAPSLKITGGPLSPDLLIKKEIKPVKIGGSLLSPRPSIKKEIKLEKDSDLQTSHIPLKEDSQKPNSNEDRPPVISPKTNTTENKSVKSQVRSSGSASTKNVQRSSSKPSVLVSTSGVSRMLNKETAIKNQLSSTSGTLNVKPKSNTMINVSTENRSSINFSAEPIIDKDAVFGKCMDAAKREKIAITSIGFKYVDSDKSLKDLIEAAQVKQKEAQSLSRPLDNATPAVSTHVIDGKSLSPVSAPVSSENSFQKDTKVFYPSKTFGSPPVLAQQLSSHQPKHEEYEQKTSPAYRQPGGSLSGGTEASIACDALEGMMETLSRTKESIGRATRLALNCAKYGIASEVVELLIRKLEMEPSLHRRIDLFFLVDSITQCSHGQKGIAGASFIPTVQAALPRLLGAAAPPGAGAQENRHQCLKVLAVWLERKVFPESLLRRYMDDIVVSNNSVNVGFLLKRPSRAERSVDDPIREMEDMFVYEYGRKGDEIGSQDARGKRAKIDYFHWNEEMADELLALLVEEVKNGNRMANGNFKKYTIEQNVIPILEEKFGKMVRYNHIYNKIKLWRKKLEPVESVMKNNSGFGWDPITNRLICSDETWNSILQAHPNTPPLRNKYFARFDEYMMVVGSHGATDKGASGLGADGVEYVRSENVHVDDVVVDSMVGDTIETNRDIPQRSTAVPLRASEFEHVQSTTASQKHRRTNGKVTFSHTGDRDAILINECKHVNKTLDTLANEVKIMRTRNIPWIDAVNATPGFSYFQKWNVLNDTTSQDLKDNFVRMNLTERSMFMKWRLNIDIPTIVNEDDDTQNMSRNNDFF